MASRHGFTIDVNTMLVLPSVTGREKKTAKMTMNALRNLKHAGVSRMSEDSRWNGLKRRSTRLACLGKSKHRKYSLWRKKHAIILYSLRAERECSQNSQL
jgi:hypothetical protein